MRDVTLANPQGRIWLRSREQSLGIGLTALVFALIAVGKMSSERGHDRIVWAIAAGAFLIVGARLALMGARAEEYGLRVRNFLATRLILWTDVKSIRVGTYRLVPRVAIVDLRDGRSLPVWAIAGPPRATRPGNVTAELLVDQLNNLHMLARDAGGKLSPA